MGYYICSLFMVVVTKSKEAWDIYSRKQSKLKHEVLIASKKPEHSYVKLNVDGSAKGQLGTATAGGIIRDGHSNWILGFTYKIGISFFLTCFILE
ncbi:Uncharacterized protein TCM_035058 [Theobroma cacao]|uniref:RNase H type-1 domain-containing protein n=1 Tax=Theobroma cacao TaxID=3641 RepID=A0A061FFY7_THECC|nr:Uncharacterized protein TCM_035058 [Theobroma cacao]